ncbi:hypothetical protein V8E54_005932 [Elaphomyces granulatus]
MPCGTVVEDWMGNKGHQAKNATSALVFLPTKRSASRGTNGFVGRYRSRERKQNKLCRLFDGTHDLSPYERHNIQHQNWVRPRDRRRLCVMFYPKFHCELNYFWGDGKRRKDFSTLHPSNLVPSGLSSKGWTQNMGVRSSKKQISLIRAREMYIPCFQSQDPKLSPSRTLIFGGRRSKNPPKSGFRISSQGTICCMQQMDQQTSITPNCGGIKINGTINAGGSCFGMFEFLIYAANYVDRRICS